MRRYAHSDDDIMPTLIAFIRELGRMPTWGELRVRERSVAGFPTIFRHGKKHELAERLAGYCARVPGHDDIATLCALPDAPTSSASAAKAESTDGYVYVLKSGKHYKVGRTNALGRREYEIGLQLPEKATTVHTIRTDDPVGIEAYWHKRFADRRRNGEWFELSADDVRAFKRRKFM